AEPLYALARLVETSLVGLTPGDESRLTMLATVREYARELLERSEDATATALAHATWCAELAERARSLQYGHDADTWQRRLTREEHNLRAALDWARARDDQRAREVGLRIAGALGPFWSWNGAWREGSDRLRELLATTAHAPPRVRGRAQQAAAGLSRRLGDFEMAAGQLEDALALYRELGDHRDLASVLHQLGTVAVFRG